MFHCLQLTEAMMLQEMSKKQPLESHGQICLRMELQCISQVSSAQLACQAYKVKVNTSSARAARNHTIMHGLLDSTYYGQPSAGILNHILEGIHALVKQSVQESHQSILMLLSLS